MGTSRLFHLLILGASLSSLMAAAPEPVDTTKPPKPKPKTEAEATVTVTAESTAVETVKTPNPVKVVASEEIKRSSASTAAELLGELLPGQILTSGGVGTATSFFLGGSRNQDVTVMVDGLRVKDAAGMGGINLNALGISGLDRVEIQQGPSSARFGADAMGGVVAFYSAGTVPDGFTGEVRGGIGSQGIRSGSIAPAYGWGSGWVRVGFSALREDQATETLNPYRSLTSHVGFGQAFGDKVLLAVNYRNGYQGVPIPYFQPDSRLGLSTPWAYREGREDRLRVELISASLRAVFSPTLSGELVLGQMVQDRLEPRDPNPKQGPMDYNRFEPFDSRRSQVQGSLQWNPAPNMGLGISTEACQESASISDYFGGRDRGEGRHVGVALEPTMELTPDVRLTFSTRHQWDRQGFCFKTGSASQPEVRSSETTQKTAINWILDRGFRAYVSVGTGYSVPFLYSVMYNHQATAWYVGTLEPLAPEKSRFSQAGLTWAQGRWSARLEASRTTFSELVFWDNTTWTYRNGSAIRIQGVEAGLTYRADQWGLDGTYRNQEARDLNVRTGSPFASDAVVRRPFQSLGFKAYWTWNPFRADLRWSWFGSRYDSFGSPVTIQADRRHFNDLEAAFAWEAGHGLSLTLRGKHLLQPRTSREEWLLRSRDAENDASMVRGYPAQPPTVNLEARYRF